MMDLDGWSIGIALVAGYVAVTSLVALMRLRRETLIAELLQQVAVERRKLKLRQRHGGRDRPGHEERGKKAA